MRERREEFVLTADHLKLLARAYVGWQDCETGAPEINPKRPYGNSSVAYDVAEILGWTLADVDLMDREQMDRALEIHRETEWALQILLTVPNAVPGLYRLGEQYNRRSWHLVAAHPTPETDHAR